MSDSESDADDFVSSSKKQGKHPINRYLSLFIILILA